MGESIETKARTPKKARRNHGTGTVEARGPERFRARMPDGHGGYITLGNFTTDEAASKALREAIVDVARGTFIAPASSDLTFAEFSARYLESRADDLRQRSFENYKAAVRNHMIPKLGPKLLREIDTAEVRKWYRGMKGAGPSARANAYRVLHVMMAEAVEQKKIASNPCTLKGASTYAKPKRRPPTLDQVCELMELVKPSRQALVALAAFGGLRLGEVLGLTRRHVSPDGKWVTIDQAAHETQSGQQFTGPTKSDAGERVIKLPKTIVPYVERHLEMHTGPEPDAWLFTGERRGNMLRRGVWTHEWQGARARVQGCNNLRYHDLRHFFGTHAITHTGGSIADNMEAMGHSSSAASLLYQAATGTGSKKIAAGFDKKLRKRSAKQAKAARKATDQPA